VRHGRGRPVASGNADGEERSCRLRDRLAAARRERLHRLDDAVVHAVEQAVARGLVGAVERLAEREHVRAAVALEDQSLQAELGWFMLIASIIPLSDAVIVLHQGGSRTIAFGVHGGTAVAILIISGLLL